MRFSEITGHKETLESLKKIVDSGKIPHAILISGRPGIGKMRIARALAQYVQCQKRNAGDSCGVCPSCIQNRNLNNPDTHYIFPLVKREKEGVRVSKDLISKWQEMLGTHSYMPFEKWSEIINAGNSQPAIFVSESEDLLYRASLSSFQENYKIFIIWLPEKMRPEAANKLLKIIEEPFEDTLFIFVSNEPTKILPTIYSRLQIFRLSPINEEEIAQELVKKENLTDEEAKSFSRLSEGSMDKAIEYVSRSEELKEFEDIFKNMMRACYGLQAKKMKSISEIIASMGREKILRFLAYCARMLRENFIFNLGISRLNIMTDKETEFSKNFAPFIHHNNIEELTSEIEKAALHIERNANAKIVMFDFLFIVSRLLKTR